jgi:CHAD domain-containing protein
MVRARRPPSRSPPGSAALARYIERLRAGVVVAVDDLTIRAHPSPESLHDLHRSMRRLRHAFGLWEQLLPPSRRAALRPLDRRLTRLARLVGQVRDRDVMLALIESAGLPKPPTSDLPRVARLRARLRDDGRTGRELLRVFLRSERDAGLFDELRAALAYVPRRAAPAPLRPLLAEEWRACRERVRAARRRARRRPSSSRLHRLRIRVRRLRHLAELVAHVDPGHPMSLSPAVTRVQAELGRLHDLDVVLDGLDPDTVSTAWGDALRDERRRLRSKIRDSLGSSGWFARTARAAVPGARGRASASGA